MWMTIGNRFAVSHPHDEREARQPGGSRWRNGLADGARRPPDLLLVDVKMPGIDGMEVLRRVKEMDPHLPVVLITAYAEIPASVAAMRAGAFDYLANPSTIRR